MRFGHFFTMANPDWELTYPQVLANAEEQTVFAEQAGYDVFWLGEHHLNGNGYNIEPNPVMAALHLAARTSRIRVGLAAVILTLWHPLRAAEDLALLDHYSHGRLECGLGRGLGSAEAMNYNLDADRRNERRQWALFREQVEIIKKAWTEDPFSYNGLFYRFPFPGGIERRREKTPAFNPYVDEKGDVYGISVIPRPLQQPMPPMWNVLDNTKGAILDAELGLKPILWLRSEAGLREVFEAYNRRASEVEGRRLRWGENTGLMKVVVVAETMEKARTISEPCVNNLYDYVGGRQRRPIFEDPGVPLRPEEMAESWWDFLWRKDQLYIGTPDSVAEQIARMRETFDPDDLLVYTWLPGMPQRDVLRSMELFAERVIPRFRISPAEHGVPSQPAAAGAER